MCTNIDDILQKKSLEVFEESFDIAKYVSSVVDKEEGRKIIIHVLDIWNNVHEETKSIWRNLIERAGFYPYLHDNDNGALGVQANIRRQWYKSDHLPHIYFHAKQKVIERKIEAGQNIAVSAPTSFGKSLLIEEVVASEKFNNILIIQPTLALIDETRRKMKKYENYNVVVNTLQQPKNRNIFILTAERVLEYKNMPSIDFFIVDEFYKVSGRRNDERVSVLNIAIHNILFKRPQSLFLTPSVDSLSAEFMEKYEVSFFKTEYSLVNTNVHEIRLKKAEERRNKLFEMLCSKKEPSLVYTPSPNKAYKLANEYRSYLLSNSDLVSNRIDVPLVEWIDKNVSEEWRLKDLLASGIGVHNGELPRHIVTSQLDYFEQGLLNTLFVTTSLIEGVNTAAKNMYIFETKKAKKPIDFFDYANIRGRAGRMNRYFTGEVYIFGKIPEKEEFQIDVPFVEQELISDEVLVNLLDGEVKEENKLRLTEIIENIPKELIDIFKRNTVTIEGQKKLYRYIEENYVKLHPLLYWGQGIPKYESLTRTLHLAYKFLEGKDSERYVNKMATLSLKTVNSPSMKNIISEQVEYSKKSHSTGENMEINKDEIVEKAIGEILSFIRKDAGYKIPKLLNVIESIQQYVFRQHGFPTSDYSYFASRLENEMVDERLRMLIDFGVPVSAVRTISGSIPVGLETEEGILRYIRRNFKKVSKDLIAYERILLSEV
ncbi:helicase [Listeria booriae]|uniref:DEAD/DEAH box helicase n=1 Tax=Listeria booriae TaxID=1552123 RepID=UPI0016296069|nr:DEAD/DEAH box helicase [Listeria booriae]MBC2078769.1 helicase [Listeria booriae]